MSTHVMRFYREERRKEKLPQLVTLPQIPMTISFTHIGNSSQQQLRTEQCDQTYEQAHLGIAL